MSGRGINLSINLNQLIYKEQQQTGKAGAAKQGKSIYAGNLKVGDEGKNPLIEQKRQFARKQAMKLIGDAWEKDNKSAQSIDGMWDEKAKKVSELNGLRSEITEIDDKKAALQEEYGVDPDSQEQKDLELLEKYQNNLNGASFDSFTEEELDRLHELQGTSRTEYQSRALALNDQKNVRQVLAKQKENEIAGLASSITSSEIDKLKTHDMVDASKAGEEIIDAANKEIFGMLIQDAKDNIDEKMEEEVEKAKDAAEKKEEQDEKIEEAREKREEQQEIIEGANEADKIDQELKNTDTSASSIEEAQKNIQRIMKENNLINEDIKGINIDLGF